MQNEPPGADTLITACPYRDGPKLEFIKYLARGPYRSLQDHIKIEQVGEDYIVRCTDLKNWPANVLFNFCIATRIPIEESYVVDGWTSMVKAGVCEHTAYALAAYYNHYDDDPTKPIMARPRALTHHFPMDSSSSIHNLITGTFVPNKVSQKSFHESPSEVKPCNQIWGYSNLTERTLIQGKSPIEISALNLGAAVG